MKRITKLTLLLLALLIPATALAYDFEVDGIYYKISGTNATVTYKGSNSWIHNSYSGDVTIPSSVTYNGTTYSVKYIDNCAFSSCSDLTSITIPSSISYIFDDAFTNCSGLTTITVDRDNPNYDSRGNCNAIIATATNTLIVGCQNTIIPNSVTSICGDAFYGCSSLTSINIPNSVTTIGFMAFSGCIGLTNVTIGNSVVTIEDEAFSGCSSLTSITIPNSVIEIGSGVFEECRSLTSITIPSSVISIGNVVFMGCSALTNIKVDTGNSKYDSRNNCNAIIETATNTLLFGCRNTIIPNSVTAIGWRAFSGCIGLTNVIIGNSVVTIEDNAFSGCSDLTSITIPNSVTSIGSHVFEDCYNLTGITIPNSVTSIGEESFFNCSKLTRVNITDITAWCNIKFLNDCANPLCYAHHLFLNDTEITELTIPNSVTSIGNYAFYNYSGLTSITLPNSVTSIGSSAFYGCSGLTSITIPNSVTDIGYYAFSGCSDLNEVYSYISDLPQLLMGSYVFSRNPANYNNRTLYVPIGTSTAYQADNKWSQYFGNIVEIDPVPASAIELDKTSAVVIEGQTLQLTATVLPNEAYNKSISWASSNPAVATVDENGLVSAHEVGTATITAVTTDGTNLSAACTITVRSLSADNCFSLPDVEVLHGETVTIPVQMNNQESIMAFQTDICLPEGFTLVTNEDNEPLITPSSRLTSDHVIMADILNDGSVRVICYTPRSKVISGNEGNLFYITVAVPEDASGDYAIYLRNSLLTTTDYTELSIPDAGAVINVKTYIPGDVNDSRSVTVTDIVVTAQYILQRNPNPFIFDAADMNGDGNISVTDIMLIARLVMTPTANAPMRMPALETNVDRLSGEGIAIATGETRRVSIALDNTMVYSAFQLDLNLPQGLTASNFALTDRAGSHVLDVQALSDGKLRALCYSPVIEPITGNEGALLTFDVTASGPVAGDITVDGIEMVTTACQTVLPQAFTIPVNNTTAVTEASAYRTVARVDYYNAAGQRLNAPATGLTIIVTTYTDGTHTTSKVFHQ